MKAANGETPVVIGLMLCDQIIVDKDTIKPSLIGIFTRLGVQNFQEVQRFSVFVALTNGQGKAELELEAVRLDTGDPIYKQRYPTGFPDPLAVVNINIRIRNIRFPAPGWYDFVFRINGEPLAQRRIEVYSIPPSP